MGSPPPTRGTPLTQPIILIFGGITPAYAGNTYLVFVLAHLHQDHPRLRGEHNHVVNDTKECAGSPPPTRGTPFIFVRIIFYLGITPAYAGNTEAPYSTEQSDWDHPRLRGEHRMQPEFCTFL